MPTYRLGTLATQNLGRLAPSQLGTPDTQNLGRLPLLLGVNIKSINVLISYNMRISLTISIFPLLGRSVGELAPSEQRVASTVFIQEK